VAQSLAVEAAQAAAARAAAHAATAQEAAARAAAHAGHSPSSAWVAVAAGLGAALIVAGATLLVARKQRTADAEHLERQLANDRHLRDLEHLRAALQEIIVRALDVEPLGDLLQAVDDAKSEPGAERIKVRERRLDVMKMSAEIGKDILALSVIVPSTGTLILALKDVRDAHQESYRAVKDWLAGSLTDPEVDEALSAADEHQDRAIARFLREAYSEVGARLDSDQMRALRA
jgi:hypothetical protein